MSDTVVIVVKEDGQFTVHTDGEELDVAVVDYRIPGGPHTTRLAEEELPPLYTLQEAEKVTLTQLGVLVDGNLNIEDDEDLE